MLSNANLKVYLATGSTDMRKSINGLSILISEYLELNPLSGNLFAFCNRKKTIIKILYWDRNGFCLFQKRLEKHRFPWPDSKEQVLALNRRELLWLMEGLDIQNLRGHKTLKFNTVY